MRHDGERASEERQLALLVGSAVDYAIFVLDPGGHVVTWNAGAERMKGYTRDEIVGQHFSTFYTDEDRARDHPAHELLVAAHDGRYEEEGWRVRKDGSRFWANIVITAIRDDDGSLLGFGKVSRDLTARRLGEEQTRARALELEDANRRLDEVRRLVASVRDYAIFMLDPGGHVRSWNAGAEQLKGWTAEEIVGRHFSTFYTEADRARDHPAHELEIAVREGRYEEEGWRVRKDGTTFWASVVITAVDDDHGRLSGFAKVTRDLTERKRAQDALLGALDELRRANEELDRFASVAAHDMAEPLRTIAGFAELLTGTDPPPDVVRRHAEHIQGSSRRLMAMLEGLLAYARASRDAEAAPEPVELAAAAEQVRGDLAGLMGERSATVAIDVPAGASVLADPHDVRLVLQNLVSNALKFGAPAGPAVAIGATPDGDGWRVTVDDDGPGVPAEQREAIFTPFRRASAAGGRAGYGLGLSIAERLVVRHGGAIGVEPGPGGGSRFWFALPA